MSQLLIDTFKMFLIFEYFLRDVNPFFYIIRNRVRIHSVHSPAILRSVSFLAFTTNNIPVIRIYVRSTETLKSANVSRVQLAAEIVCNSGDSYERFNVVRCLERSKTANLRAD